MWSKEEEDDTSRTKRANKTRKCDRHRIINYDYYQAENICAIASGAVESTVKQIDRRLKISGARREASPLGQWNSENVPQVLKHRCAYLNHAL